MTRLLFLCAAALTVGCSSSPNSSSGPKSTSGGAGTGTPPDTGDTGSSGAPAPTTGASAGGCEWVSSYCYDFVGTSWNPTSAEYACDQISANLVAGGAPPGVFVSSGCPGGATAECTGIGSDAADPGSEFVIYYYDAFPLTVAQDACVSGGGTYTEL
jgi:hypothetical protein